MKAQFMELLRLQGMMGVVLLSGEGRVLFQHALTPQSKALEGFDWSGVVAAL